MSTFKCRCGKYVMKSGVNRHLRTNKHRRWVKTKECGVCYETGNEFVECRQCQNMVCTECVRHFTRNRCPYCRKPNFTESLPERLPESLPEHLPPFFRFGYSEDEMRLYAA